MLWKKNVYNQDLKFMYILKQYPEFQQISSDKFTDSFDYDIFILVKYSFCLRSNLNTILLNLVFNGKLRQYSFFIDANFEIYS